MSDFHAAIQVHRHVDDADAHKPLFFAPGLNGNAGGAKIFAEYLPENLPVYGITAPPREELSEDTIPTVAKFCVERMREVQPEGPYRLAGYSFGGRVAHQIACYLDELGQVVDGLFLFDVLSCLQVEEPRKHAPDSTYYLQPVFSGEAVLLRCWERPMGFLHMPSLGWQHLCRTGVVIYDQPTVHWGLNVLPHSERVASVIAQYLGVAHSSDNKTAIKPDAAIPYSPLPEAFCEAKHQCSQKAYAAAWRALMSAPDDSLYPWMLDFAHSVGQTALPNEQLPKAFAQSKKKFKQPLDCSLEFVSYFLKKGLPIQANKMLALAEDSLPAWISHPTFVLAKAICADGSNEPELLNRLLKQLAEMLQNTPDCYYSVVEAFSVSQPEVAKKFHRLLMQYGSKPAKASLYAQYMFKAVRVEKWDAAAQYGKQVINHFAPMYHVYPLLIYALTKCGNQKDARLVHAMATRWSSNWGNSGGKLDMALAGTYPGMSHF